MAIAIETNAPARIVEIDGVNIAFDETDVKMARIHVQKDGQKGPLKKDDLIEWFKAEQPFYDIPEPAEKKAKVAKDDSNDVAAELIYHKLTSKGQIGKAEHREPITRGMIRELRRGLRGRASSQNYLDAIIGKIESDWVPVSIIDTSSNVHEITKTDAGKWVAVRNRESTEGVLRTRLAEVEAQLEAYEAKLAERESE